MGKESVWWLEPTLRVTQQQMQAQTGAHRVVSRSQTLSRGEKESGYARLPTGCAQDDSDKKCGKWECFTQCKPLTVDAIVSFKASFGLPVEKVRQA